LGPSSEEGGVSLMPNIQGPDGKVISFPEGTSDADIASAFSSMSQPAAPVSQHPYLDAATDFGKGLLKSGISTMSAADDFAQKHLPAFMTTPIGQAPTAENSARAVATAKQMGTPNNTAQSIGKAVGGAAQFLAPTGIEAAGAKLGGALLNGGGEIAGSLAGSALNSGIINKAQGGGFGTGAAAGAAGTGLGMAMKAAAPAMAETAMRVRGNDRLFGRTVGEAILNDTTGVNPSTVADSARAKISELTPQISALADEAGKNGVRGSLAPARAQLGQTVDKYLGTRAMDSAADLNPLVNSLKTDGVTGLPLAESQTPSGLRAIKQGINSDYISNWKLDQAPGLKSSARSAYGAINDEFHNAVPGVQELDQRISSLIPVIKRAEAVDSNAGLLQRTAGRVMAHTGAATLGATGAYSGYKEGGLPGALAGGIAGIVVPEMLSSPTTQMIAARGLNNSIPNYITPFMKGTLLQVNSKK
jgi:hypothetical protein